MKGIIKNSLFYIIITVLILLYFIFPSDVSKYVKDGIFLCINTVIPSLFIFFILSYLFINSGMCEAFAKAVSPPLSGILKISAPAACVFLLSLIAGYPSGGVACAQLYKNGVIDRLECERLLMFSNNCGPAFIVSAVGSGMLGSVHLGYMLLIIHIASAFLVGIISGSIFPPSFDVVLPSRSNKKHFSPLTLITDSIKFSARLIFDVCAVIVTFYSLIGLIFSCGIPDLILKNTENAALIKGAMCALLELTCGTEYIASSGGNLRIVLTLICAALGAGGLCVHIQLAPYVKDAGLRLKKYALGKTLHAVFSGIIMYIAFPFF